MSPHDRMTEEQEKYSCQSATSFELGTVVIENLTYYTQSATFYFTWTFCALLSILWKWRTSLLLAVYMSYKFKSFISVLINHINSERRNQNQIPRLDNVTATEVMNIFSVTVTASATLHTAVKPLKSQKPLTHAL